MKILTRDIVNFQEKDFFLPIRDKLNYAWIVIHSARLLLLNFPIKYDHSGSILKLIVGKMSRLFFYQENNFYSITFPFNVIVEDNSVLQINSYSGKQIDSQVISSVISILNNERFKLNPSPIDFWVDSESLETEALSILEEIFLFEPGYVRFDNDPINEDGKRHPLNHLDINYSSYGTFKLGLNDIIIQSYFEDILNITTDCSFITRLAESKLIRRNFVN